MKNKNKVIVVALCAIFVFSSLTAPVFAQNENITKEESVYVISATWVWKNPCKMLAIERPQMQFTSAYFIFYLLFTSSKNLV